MDRRVFEYQARICRELPPGAHHEVIFCIRERYELVGFVAEGAARYRAEGLAGCAGERSNQRSRMDTLTDEQREYWDQIGWDRELPEANEGQTAEQALNFTVASLRFAFKLEGLPVPSAEAITNELARST